MSIIKNSSGLNMVDALFESDGDPTFHGWDATGDAKIDYILSTRNLGFHHFQRDHKELHRKRTNVMAIGPLPYIWLLMCLLFLAAASTDANGISASSATNIQFCRC